MAKRRADDVNRTKERPSTPGPLHAGITKDLAAACRRSGRLREKRVLVEFLKRSPLSPSSTSDGEKYRVAAPQVSRGLKRQFELEDEIEHDPQRTRPRKRLRRAPVYHGALSPDKRSSTHSKIIRIDHWRRKGKWPKQYFNLDEGSQAGLQKYLDGKRWYEDVHLQNMGRPDMDRLEGKEGAERRKALLARQPSTSSLRIQSELGFPPRSPTPNDQRVREAKSIPYNSPIYEALLGNKFVFMDEDDEGPTRESKDLCLRLLDADQQIPSVSRFSDDIFRQTCRRLKTANESKVIDKIARLIVPSVEDLADSGSKHLSHLVESVNDGWTSCIPILRPRPQPDYSVGFGLLAFTEERRNKLNPWIGTPAETSYFKATHYLYFPFFVDEVKCGAAALDIADKQNLSSTAHAVRGIVELFGLKGRKAELNRQILVFSVSHDHRTVRLYGYYPVIAGNRTSVYRHPIHMFDITALDGKERWTSYRFTRNVYDIWMPKLFEMLCSVIDRLPEVDFEQPEGSELQFQDNGPSQPTQDTGLSQSLLDYGISPVLHPPSFHGDSEGSISGAQNSAPATLASQPARNSKKSKKRAAAASP